jgi:hypothetical protein
MNCTITRYDGRWIGWKPVEGTLTVWNEEQSNRFHIYFACLGRTDGERKRYSEFVASEHGFCIKVEKDKYIVAEL